MLLLLNLFYIHIDHVLQSTISSTISVLNGKSEKQQKKYYIKFNDHTNNTAK